MIFELLVGAALATQPVIDTETRERIDRILAQTPLVDGHNDLPIAARFRRDSEVTNLQSGSEPLHTDMDRLKQGGVGAQLWSIYIPASVTGDEAVRYTLEQFDITDRLIAQYPDTLEWAKTAADIERIHASGKIASMAGIEGGHQIGNGNLAVLRQFKRLGAIYMTLTHGRTTGWVDSATDDPKHGGISDFGNSVLEEMNRIGMLIDLSHVTEEAMHDALDVTKAPVIFSHSSARALGSHPRNVPDSVLERLPENGGVVMVTFVPSFLDDAIWQHGANRDAEEARLDSLYTGDPEGKAAALAAWDEANPRPVTSVARVADHVEHIARVAGYDHVGIGGDFDGISTTVPYLDSVDDYPNLLAELIDRGWTDDQLCALVGGNFLRALKGAEAVAASMPHTDAVLGTAPIED